MAIGKKGATLRREEGGAEMDFRNQNPGVGTHKKERYHRWEGPPLGRKKSSHTLSTQVLGTCT